MLMAKEEATGRWKSFIAMIFVICRPCSLQIMLFVIMMIKLKKIRLAGHIARMGEMRIDTLKGRHQL
jgi:hypothetical protein